MKFSSTVLLIVLGFLSATIANDEVEIDFDNAPGPHFPYNGRIVLAQPAFEDYAYMLFDVCDALSIEGEDCLIYPLTASIGYNAIATILDGNRVIIYGYELSPFVGYEGAEMIIAHEVGHHYCGHLTSPHDPKNELVADAFAGAAARMLGRSLDDALSYTDVLAVRPSLTHPQRQMRINAITAGWNDPVKAKDC